MELKTFFEQHPRFAVAFSGGVDSSYLLYAAMAFGCDVKAYFVKTPLTPQFELDDAKKLAFLISAPLSVEYVDILKEPSVTSNPADRCYHCKKLIFTRIIERARADGFEVICDGTNATDDSSERAGMRALEELGVRSPLRECGLTKKQIRDLSRAAGLFTHDKPSYACLATRVPTGVSITQELLDKVEQAEMQLRTIGFSDIRVRLLADGSAKIQIPEYQFKMLLERRTKILDLLKPYFSSVLVDLVPRRSEG